MVVVGGAAGLDAGTAEALRGVFIDHLEPLLARMDAVVVDGGTDSGVMQTVGRAVAARGHRVPLLGVVVESLAADQGSPPSSEGVALEPNHDLVLLVPGSEWGDESPWIDQVASAVAEVRPSATLVVNGGAITYSDVELSLRAGRRVVVVAGTGRAADEIARAARGEHDHPRAAAIASHALVHVVGLDRPEEMKALLGDLLRGGR